MAQIADILELVAAALWLGLGIYLARRSRALLRRLDTVVSELERDVYR